MKDLKIAKNGQDIMKSMKKREVGMGKVVACAFLLLTLGVMFAGVVPVAAATTWYVDDSGGADFTTIQAAVNAANLGDIIFVRDGTYYENVDVNKPHLTIQSENGADKTIVQAARSSDHVLVVKANYVNISGFMVKRGYGRPSTAGIYLYEINCCDISNNKVLGNNQGICLIRSFNCNIINNNVNSNTYSGIRTTNSFNVNIVNNNVSLHQYGIYIGHSSSNHIVDNNSILNNEEGIRLEGYSFGNRITNNSISSNEDGILLWDSSENIITNNNISNNDGTGMFFISNSSNNNIAHNNILNSQCEGILLRGTSSSNNISNINKQ